RRHTSSKRDWSSDVCSSDLSCDRLLRTLTRTRIGLGTLTTDWQATTVAQTLVANDFNLATNVSLNLTAEVTLYLPGSFNCVTQCRQPVISQVTGTQVRRNAGLFQQLLGTAWADSVNVSERDLHALVAWKINTS